MEQKKEQEQRIRKERAKNGERTQKMMAFRVDLDNLEWLEQQANKGRYLNDLIAADRRRGR